MKESLIKVALHYQALYLFSASLSREPLALSYLFSASLSKEPLALSSHVGETKPLSRQTLLFVQRLNKFGYSLAEETLQAVNHCGAKTLASLVSAIEEVYAVKLNWTPLVKGWDTPTGESYVDHFITMCANVFGLPEDFKGTTLPCGHIIPDGTFPLERYNGCPFCGTPFQISNTTYSGQGSRLKTLRLWTDNDLMDLRDSLISSPVPLDATQVSDLKVLLSSYPLPDTFQTTIKETATVIASLLIDIGASDRAASLVQGPNDIIRLLWYRHTGYPRLIRPAKLVEMVARGHHDCWYDDEENEDWNDVGLKAVRLRLHYSRPECLRYASWLNTMKISPQAACEQMHPYRGMWVRFIRALRLAEYAHKEGFDYLATLLDCFYRKDYTVTAGLIDKARKRDDAYETLELLVANPGLFARGLFSNMLRFGPEPVLESFRKIMHSLPTRLILTLGMYADSYFDPTVNRSVQTITGMRKRIDANPSLSLYDDEELHDMVRQVQRLYLEVMSRRYAAIPDENKTMYIDPVLFSVPLSIGDRSSTIQDASCALQGMTFPVEGDKVRLFMQWGEGLKAQHMDMDLSCIIAYDGRNDVCSYYNLSTVGAVHSGDIRYIPDNVGAAEYIELSLSDLNAAGARYCVFSCNAYSTGNLSPNLSVGWMNSANPMEISEETGVAYDPSTVQHRVRIATTNLSKGLVFGVLDVARREIVWMELPFGGQIAEEMDCANVRSYLRRLNDKVKIGELLKLKADVQKLEIVDSPDQADESYTLLWALNPAEVAKTLIV